MYGKKTIKVFSGMMVVFFFFCSISIRVRHVSVQAFMAILLGTTALPRVKIIHHNFSYDNVLTLVTCDFISM